MLGKMERFRKFYSIDSETGCWLWNGHKCRLGYGFFTDQRAVKAHRFAYQHFRGPIPEGLVLDHLCKIRHCVNPTRLEAVPQKTNVLRGVGPSAINARKTHCIRGHPLSGDNLYLMRSGKRNCKACRNRCSLLRYYRRKADLTSDTKGD